MCCIHRKTVKQLLGTDLVRHVGVYLAGVDRVAVHAVELGALDLAVPVGALDQADHRRCPSGRIKKRS